MLQHSRRTPGRARGTGGDTGSETSPDTQSKLGNSALAERTVGSAGNDAALQNDEVGSWLTEGLEAPVKGPEATTEDLGPKVRGPESETTTGASRPSSVKGGMKGALISGGGKIELRESADDKATVSQTIADGTACEVSSTSGTWIKVKVRVGTSTAEGWVAASVFSDQPGLTKDDEHKGLTDDFVFSKVDGDHTPKAPTGKETAQGQIGDCYLIASMAAVANASPQTIKDMVTYNKEKGTYTVRFYEESGYGQSKPVYIEVDSYLPTSAANRKDPVYAGAENGPMWSAIIEKAYAKWKGGYDKIGEGGYGASTMAEITGSKSQSKNPSSMKEDEVIPYFQAAKEKGMAIYAAVEHDQQSAVTAPFTGSGDGPYKATISHTHRWNHIVPGSLRIDDKNGKAGSAQDQGHEGDLSAKITGSKVESGSIDYKSNAAELKYKAGGGPAAGEDLQVKYNYQGVVDTEKMLIANHAYAFEGVVTDGKELQFYNPWGSWQPKAITPGEFLKYFTNIATNQAPAGATKG